MIYRRRRRRSTVDFVTTLVPAPDPGGYKITGATGREGEVIVFELTHIYQLASVLSNLVVFVLCSIVF